MKNNIEFKIFDTKDSLYDYAAKIVIEQVKSKPSSILGLATGSSPIGLYERMIKDHNLNKTSYKLVKTFNLDEYVGLSKDHEQSYISFMKKNLFRYIDIESKNINIPNGNCSDTSKECIRYNSILNENKRDIQILGIGSNGHIAFNEPNTSFESTCHVVDLTEKTRLDNSRFFSSIDDVPRQAITMGISEILNSNKIILIATGDNKSEAIKKLAEGKIDIKCPATSLLNHKDVLVLLDKQAAKLIY